MQIEGVPEGWEAVAFGPVIQGEWYVSSHTGTVLQWRGRGSDQSYLKIRRVEPVCTWQHGVFTDGWIAQDPNGSLWLYSDQPTAEEEGWVSRHNNGYCMRLNRRGFVTEIVFRPDLPWTARIQQVGPTVEATLKVMT